MTRPASAVRANRPASSRKPSFTARTTKTAATTTASPASVPWMRCRAARAAEPARRASTGSAARHGRISSPMHACAAPGKTSSSTKKAPTVAAMPSTSG
jgi:hypothetical protein